MKEIKFRAWIKGSKFMIYLENRLNIKAFFDNTYYLDSNTINDSCVYFSDNEFELMQCICLKDKNKKEVYEGDILKNPIGLIGEVVYLEGSFCWKYRNEKGKLFYSTLTTGLLKNKEIIGNIFENPKLKTK